MRAPISRICAGLLLVCAVATANAERIDVAAPDGVGVVAVDDDGVCSLREAIDLANAAAANADCTMVPDGSDALEIRLPMAAIFTITGSIGSTEGENGLPSVETIVVIEGHGSVIERQDTADYFRILHVAPAGDLVLRHVVLANGNLGTSPGVGASAQGGAILNQGKLEIAGVTIRDSKAGDCTALGPTAGGSGGGIASTGSLRVVDSAIHHNSAGGGCDGMPEGNGGDGGSGGGIFSAGTLTVLRSTIVGNVAGVGGEAGINVLGAPPVPGVSGSGAGVHATGSVWIADSAIVDNQLGAGPGESGNGAGLYLAATGADQAIVVRTTVARNAATSGSLGSGVFVGAAADLLMVVSTVANNKAEGSAPVGGIAVDAEAEALLDFVTVSGNQNGGLHLETAIEASHSVIATQASGADCFGTSEAYSGGGNMDSDGSCGFGTAPTPSPDLPSGDPMLGNLADNGGVGETMLPLPGSPLIDAIPEVDCGGEWEFAPVEYRIDQRRRLRPGGSACDVGAVETVSRCYVDASAASGGNGTSWASAYNDLQLALGDNCGDIWVAQGVYTPSSSGDVDASFEVVPGMKLYGGFQSGASTIDQRDVRANPTILSGDLADDDVNVDGINESADDIAGENSYQVIRIDGYGRRAAADTLLDGFYITGGDARFTIKGLAANGGGLYCDGYYGICNPHLAHLIFSGNRATYGGGALFNDASDGGVSSPHVENVIFRGNSTSEGSGGAVFNSAGDEGGVSSPDFDNVLFRSNSAAGAGGAMVNYGREGVSSPHLRNVTFFANTAYSAGALSNQGAMGVSNPVLTNVTFFANDASSSSGADAMSSDDEYGGESRPRLNNVIFWGSIGTAITNHHSASPSFRHSVVQDAYAGGIWNTDFGVDLGGNSADDPLLGWLADNGGFSPSMLPAPGGSAMDGGDDQACPATDARGVPRPQHSHCDIGAVERIQSSTLRALGQNDQRALAGDLFAEPLVVQVLNGTGGAVVGVMPAVQVPSNGASAICTSEPTNATGVARIVCAANAHIGTYTVHISTLSLGLSTVSVDYTLTNVSNDRIFGTGFGGAALPTAQMLP